MPPGEKALGKKALREISAEGRRHWGKWQGNELMASGGADLAAESSI
jgi:hypothetical protein